MKAVIMAGGSGTRLRPLTCNLPKPMVPVAGKPMSEHIVNLLKTHGFDDIVFTLHYLPDAIRDYFGDGSDFGCKISYSVEEGKPLGTAGCVKAIQDHLDSTFIVISGDSLTDMDLGKALEFHKEKKSKATLVLKRVENPLEYGVVITDNEGRIQRFVEKPGASEIFSDTVNTGTYILEPEVMLYVVMGREQDFSNDLFPLLLLRNEPMYGYVADGYWCDIGNLAVYRQAHRDVLDGLVNISLDLPQIEPGVFVGHGSQIDASVQLEGPVMIGKNCRIGRETVISKHSVIGDNVVIQEKASLKQPVIWSNAYVGSNAQLRACVVCNNSTIHNSAELLEGAIIGNNSVVGQEATVNPDVRIWPDKNIDSGAKVLESVIWGTRAPRTLFGAHGVRGLANVDITPEFAVNLAAAYGATLKGGPVLVSRDYWKVSQMISRAIVSGLASVGIEVQNLESMPLPISRYYVKTQRAAGLIHVRVSQREIDKITIEFFDSQGVAITKSMERKIETTFFKEDFPRCAPSDVGSISFPSRVREYYVDEFLNHVKGQVFEEDKVPFCIVPGSNYTRKTKLGALSTHAPKVVIDYAMAETGVLLPDLLGQLGIETVVLNSSIRNSPPRQEERISMRKQLADVVKALGADLGVQIGRNGEQMTLVDEAGQIIRGELLLATVADIILRDKPGRSIVVPVNASSVIERIASRYGCKVVRCKASETEIGSTTAKLEEAVLGGSANGCFIFPEFQNGYDAMFAVGQVLEHLTYQGRTLQQAVAELPPLYYQVDSVHCPWERKGRVMRLLVEKHQDRPMELLDGVKIQTRPDHWILVLPDAVEPLVHVYADGSNLQNTSADLNEYTQLVRYLQKA
ncbi:MAG: mannose-1-phosphate guanyltransferase [Candidatus Melainabacteria bacterium]|jgi:mannose-1-phosphate guanylyltransferase/phosphomannomutase|uniref:Mannose-1-phosphate guanyltransferase n=1 Tax=Candidatus Obscuribacter phosphatis TaxID=1906157 RepID=A0A8J7TK85_9BACT|nr:mannose-1-phosphate guanyltransferase [Candidatus Obscuribacter phosphatis]MCA0314917.1 mannose-1-phosphate guanyltransferase [Candidatus Melainabacteria bacterium]